MPSDTPSTADPAHHLQRAVAHLELAQYHSARGGVLDMDGQAALTIAAAEANVREVLDHEFPDEVDP